MAGSRCAVNRCLQVSILANSRRASFCQHACFHCCSQRDNRHLLLCLSSLHYTTMLVVYSST